MQPIQSPHSNLPALSGSSTLGHSVPALLIPGPGAKQPGMALCLRPCWNDSSQLIKNLLTLHYLFLPSEATITCLPLASCTSWTTVMLSHVSLHDVACPSSGDLWKTSYLFKGNHILICWPYYTPNFLLIHYTWEHKRWQHPDWQIICPHTWVVYVPDQTQPGTIHTFQAGFSSGTFDWTWSATLLIILKDDFSERGSLHISQVLVQRGKKSFQNLL